MHYICLFGKNTNIMKNIPGPAGFLTHADQAREVTTYSVVLERKRTIISYFYLECCWLRLCKDLGVDMSNCCPPHSDELYLKETKFQMYLQRWTDALIQSEVLLCNVPRPPTSSAEPVQNTQTQHATLYQVNHGAFDFCVQRLAVVVDAVVTTCTGDIILKLVDTTGSAVAFTSTTSSGANLQSFHSTSSSAAVPSLGVDENTILTQFRQLHPGSALLLQNVSVYVHRDVTATGRWSRYLCITLNHNIVAIYN